LAILLLSLSFSLFAPDVLDVEIAEDFLGYYFYELFVIDG